MWLYYGFEQRSDVSPPKKLAHSSCGLRHFNRTWRWRLDGQGTMQYTDWFRFQGSWFFSGLGNNPYMYILIYMYIYATPPWKVYPFYGCRLCKQQKDFWGGRQIQLYIYYIGSIIPYVQQTWSIVPSSTPNSFLISVTYFLKLLHVLTNAKYYCWWKKSCTTWDVQNPVNEEINYLSTGRGFPPSSGTAGITIKGSCIEKDIRVAKTSKACDK